MKIYSERIKQLRTKRSLSQDQLASMLGISRSAIGMYETGQREPDFEICEAIADIFNVDMDYLIGRSDVERKTAPNIPDGFEPLPEMVKVPLIGSIACGTPILAEENIESYIGIPAAWKADFALTCHGDSMAPMICDGDVVCIRKQAQVETGEVAAVRIGDEATLKRFYRYPDYITLRPENPEYEPIIKIGSAMNEVQIEGKAVGLCRGIGK